MEKPSEKMMEVFEEYGAYWDEKRKTLEIYPEGFGQEIILTSEDEVDGWYKIIKNRLRQQKRQNKKLIVKKEYFCFVTDNDGHWYKIPVKLKTKFEDWVEYSATYTEALDRDDLANVPDFDDYRCMHPVNYMFEKILVLKETK